MLVGFVGNIVFLLLLFATLTILNCISMPNLVGPPWNYLAILFVVLYVASFAAGPGNLIIKKVHEKTKERNFFQAQSRGFTSPKCSILAPEARPARLCQLLIGHAISLSEFAFPHYKYNFE